MGQIGNLEGNLKIHKNKNIAYQCFMTLVNQHLKGTF